MGDAVSGVRRAQCGPTPDASHDAGVPLARRGHPAILRASASRVVGGQPVGITEERGLGLVRAEHPERRVAAPDSLKSERKFYDGYIS